MGNFSRNTFDPVKDYVAVRLQQGVPMLDANWNELNDVTRQEFYDTFSLTVISLGIDTPVDESTLRQEGYHPRSLQEW